MSTAPKYRPHYTVDDYQHWEGDQTFKKNLYEQQGVSWYLIVDPDTDALQAFRLNDGEYQTIPHAETLNVDLCDGCNLSVQVERMFR